MVNKTMSYWNCRVIRHHNKETNEFYYTVHEVYYDDNGHPKHYSDDPFLLMSVTYDSENDEIAVNDLKEELEKIKRALDEKVLDVSVFEN